MPTTHPKSPRALLALATALAALLGPAAPADARRGKPAGPVLKIESKTCNTGVDDDARSIVLTASAVLRGDGEEVQMRFRVQQRPQAKTKWRTVFAKSGDLGIWATSDEGADGLRYTKTINGLEQGAQYRVVVDARGITTAGKVVTRTSRRTYTCIQPQISAHPSLVRATVLDESAPNGLGVRAYVKNPGRDDSDDVILTVRDATTQGILGQRTFDALPGRAGPRAMLVPISACPGTITISVQQVGAELSALGSDQQLTLDCDDAGETVTLASSRKASKSRH